MESRIFSKSLLPTAPHLIIHRGLAYGSCCFRNTWAVKQSWMSEKFTELSLCLARLVRTVNIVLFPSLPLFRYWYRVVGRETC